jgi:hypothetical protein
MRPTTLTHLRQAKQQLQAPNFATQTAVHASSSAIHVSSSVGVGCVLHAGGVPTATRARQFQGSWQQELPPWDSQPTVLLTRPCTAGWYLYCKANSYTIAPVLLARQPQTPRQAHMLPACHSGDMLRAALQEGATTLGTP